MAIRSPERIPSFLCTGIATSYTLHKYTGCNIHNKELELAAVLSSVFSFLGLWWGEYA